MDTSQAVEAELAAVRARTEAAMQHANSGKTAFLQLLNLQVRPHAPVTVMGTVACS